LRIEREELVAKMKDMRGGGYEYLVKITAVDYEKYLEVIYVLRNLEDNEEEMLEVQIDPTDAWVPSVVGVYKAADWYEREMQEMFGIDIKNRRSERLLLEKWNGKIAPLRKNFVWNTHYETSD
jgi:NADH-quinone oxidoreductase subunit C